MMNKKRIVILGSTGSIGQQALDVIKLHSGLYEVIGLSANNNIDLLEQQIKEFESPYIAVRDVNKGGILKERMPDKNILIGPDGVNELASLPEADIVLIAVVGIAGLKPTLIALENDKTVALATKEAMVTGGHLIEAVLRQGHGSIIPVDSEHSAIYQCLHASSHPGQEIKRILLTASGGPFRGWTINELKKVTRQQALNHPNWRMGKRITVDSATMMNKGFEIIEAHWLFNVTLEQIEVIVHPQSIIHSMVEFVDHSIIAQMGMPDMRVAISYALSYPMRVSSGAKELDLTSVSSLTFEQPDEATFKCLRLAKEALRIGGTMPVVLNAADEVAVEMFLQGRIGFTDIADVIEKAMDAHAPLSNPSLEEIYAADAATRRFVNNKLEG